MMYDIAIIGAGPAGMTAAIYAARAGMKVVIFEAMVAGGQILNSTEVNNYPGMPHTSGLDFSRKLEEQVQELGVEIIFERVEKIKQNSDDFSIVSEDGNYSSRSVILAVGTRERKLGLPNEDELIGHGISYCAVCDGAFYKDKIVAVNGGGNSALHEALYLSSIAKKIYLIHRRDTFRASASLVKKVKKCANIELIMDATITSLNGEKQLNSITLSNSSTLNIDGLFISIGRVSNVVGLLDVISLSDDNYVKSSEDCTTNIRGVFVAGDVRQKELRQLVTATSDGATAAASAISYLEK